MTVIFFKYLSSIKCDTMTEQAPNSQEPEILSFKVRALVMVYDEALEVEIINDDIPRINLEKFPLHTLRKTLRKILTRLQEIDSEISNSEA